MNDHTYTAPAATSVTHSLPNDLAIAQSPNDTPTKKMIKILPVTAAPKMVLYDIQLNYIAVSEATRNRIDNGDCKRVFGLITTELWELDASNNKKTKLASYDNMKENLYYEREHRFPPTAALSYYQDNRTEAANDVLSKVTYNIPENLLTGRKVMLVVKSFLATRHKDNDFASYDGLRMAETETSTFTLDTRAKRSETMQFITRRRGDDMVFGGERAPRQMFQGSDDTHKIWVAFTIKKQ